MNKLISPLFVLLLFSLHAQNIAPKNERVFNFTLTVQTNQGQVDAGRDLVFVETETYERLTFKTDQNGKFAYTFDHGKLWLGSVGEMRNCIELIVDYGGNQNRQLTYNPEYWERENEILPDRRSIAFTEVDQFRLSPMEEPSSKESVLNLRLMDQQRKGYAKVEVILTCFATKTKYKGLTGTNGGVTFKIPINQKYEIDVDGIESTHFIDFDSRPMTKNMTILYQPKQFTEKTDKRFIVQQFKPDVEPSSSHARIKLNIYKKGAKAINEDVYVRMLKSNKVYRAKTNPEGEVVFMLPLRGSYMVDFQYQRDAALIDLSKVKGIAYKNQSVEYIIDERLANIENFIPAVKDLVYYDVHSFVKKQYPEPSQGDVDFYLSWGNKFNASSKEALLEIGFKVKSKMNRKTTEPLNLCFVVDKSGSMSGDDRIQQLKKSLIAFVSQLDSKDMISLVVFDNVATVAFPAAPIGDKKHLIDVIHTIRADGGTNILEGLTLGSKELKKLSSKTSINRLLLLTDGYGSNPPETVINEGKSIVKSGFEISAIGVGIDYNQALLSQLASAGGGLLHLAGSSEQIEVVFQRELESILYPMAKKAELTVQYNDAIVYRQLYGYSNEEVSKGQMKVEIPNLFPGLDQLALMKFDLINPQPSIIDEKIIVTFSYEDVITHKIVTLQKKIAPEWTDATGELDMTLDLEHKKVLGVAIANQSLKMMAEAFESGNKDAALSAVKSAQQQLKNLFPKATPESLLVLVDRLQEYVDAFETLKSHASYSK